VERKYAVPDGFALPDLAAVDGVAAVDDPVAHRLDATYFDTPGYRLARQRVTLRRRAGGSDAGWHLKRPLGDDARDEAHFPLRGRSTKVPADLQDEVRVLTRGDELRPVARIQTRRRETPLLDAEGRVLALIADDKVTAQALGNPGRTASGRGSGSAAGGAGATIQRWHELEVELVDGEPPLLDAIDAALVDAGARPADAPSKLSRALGDRVPPPATREPGLAGAVLDYTRAQRDQIVTQDPLVRRQEPEAIHDMRVAARRLRSTVRTFRELFDRDRADALRAEVRWLGEELGGPRDREVMAARLDAAIASEPAELVVGPVARTTEGRLSAEAGDAHKELVAVLDSDRYLALLKAIDDVADPSVEARTGASTERSAGASADDSSDARPDGSSGASLDPPTDEALLRRVRKAYRRLARRMAEALDAPRASEVSAEAATGADGQPPLNRDTGLHEARKAAKRVRYAAEAVEDEVGDPADRTVSELKALQDALGDHHDTVVTRELLRDYGMRAHLDGENAFSYGLLHARQAAEADRLEAEAERLWAKMNRKSHRRWMR
jgi:CHAD domain-containing protein